MGNLKRDYLDRYAVGEVFIETGTYHGETVRMALEYGFKKIHTIELNEELYHMNVEQFKNNPEVKVWFGDSVDCVPQILEEIGNVEATFWLDAHASGPLPGGQYGPCPLVLELKSIMGEEVLTFNGPTMERSFRRHPIKTHTLFIDDRRLFSTAEWGFVSEQTVTDFVLQINPSYKIRLLDGHQPNDIICASVRAYE